MNTEDRELLELAAKAAGIEYKHENSDWNHEDHCAFWHYDDLCTCGARWNPLTDDGDAFRLMVKLGIDVEWREDGRLAAYQHGESAGYCFTAFESSREDRGANLRLAITRAAAEIGRRMSTEEQQ